MGDEKFAVDFYLDSRGQSELRNFLRDLRKRHDKASRIIFEKITDYIGYLETSGFTLRPPVAKHIDGAIWELRPVPYRIFYAYVDKKFILLHYYLKKQRQQESVLVSCVRKL